MDSHWRSPLVHATCFTTALRASCGGGDPKTAVAPLKKGEDKAFLAPQFIGGLGGSTQNLRSIGTGIVELLKSFD